MILKVNAKNFSSFLSKATMDGIIGNAILKFGPDGLRMTSLDESKTGGANALLYKDNSFMDYTEMTVPIVSTTRLLTFIKSVEDIAELQVEGNAFRVISENLEFSIIMGKPEHLKCPSEKWPNLGYGEGFEVDAKIFDMTRKAVSELEVKNIRIYASLDDGEFKLHVGTSKSSDSVTPKATVESTDKANAIYGQSLLDVTKVIKGNVRVAFQDDFPMMLKQENENYSIEWMVGPILDEE